MFNILGYTDKISVAAGEAMRCHISAEHNQRYEARIVRVINGDCNPLGPGFQVEHVPNAIDGWYDGTQQHTDAGSCMVVPILRGLPGSFTFAALIWPTLLAWRQKQTIASYTEDGGSGFVLTIEGGAIRLTVSSATGVQSIELPPGLLLDRHWVALSCAIDQHAGRMALQATPLRRFPVARDPSSCDARLTIDLDFIDSGRFILAGAAAPDGSVVDHFNGKIEAPTLIAGDAAPDVACRRPVHGELSRRVVAAWDFAREMSGTVAIDVGPLGQHGALVNLPARAMTGANWTGEAHDWRERPAEYGAIHFHHDDLYDAGWAVAFGVTIPADMRSGAYAVHVRCGDNSEYETNEDFIPFFVRPSRLAAGRGGAKLLFLAPTNSYVAYANDSQVLVDRNAEIGMGRLLNLQHADVYLHRHPELCASLYDKHADGSGVCYSSRLRPVLNMRPRYHSWLGSHGSALYQYNGDTHILAWLEHEGVAFDVATDEDLHHDGLALLSGYEAVITGTHPEYHSTAMWDAMRAYLDRGGRLMYMGGNGWYWRVAFHASLPGVIEVRRAESGTRTWETEAGETHQSFDGALGGLWRRIGRAPNQIVGVGFVAQGFDLSSYFRRAEGSHDPRAGFIFDGVGDELIGDFGLVGGGAAGVELDAYNERLGSPPHALVLATSENHTPLTMLTPEEFLVTPAMISGDQSDKVRADMVFFETSGGGAVFSTGSIAWAGSLSWNDYDNNVRRITGNVLHRFLDAQPFVPPPVAA